jgi:hypothetical protein
MYPLFGKKRPQVIVSKEGVTGVVAIDMSRAQKKNF